MGASKRPPSPRVETSRIATKMTKQRRVQFHPIETEVIGYTLNREDLTTDEKLAYWLSDKEFRQIRQENKRIVAEARQRACRYVVGMEDTYKSVLSLSKNSGGNSAQELFVTMKTFIQHLKEWAIACEECRGLERFVSSEIWGERSDDKKWSKAVVLNMYQGGCTAKEIATAYRGSCRGTKSLALLHGHADMRASQWTNAMKAETNERPCRSKTPRRRQRASSAIELVAA